MKNLKKISFILIGVLISLLSGLIITEAVLATDFTGSGYISDFDMSKWVLGAKMGINAYDLSDKYGNTYQEGFQLRDNLNFYCIEQQQGTNLNSGLFKIVGKVAIEGNQIKSSELLNDTLKTKTESETTRNANRIIGEIFSQAKSDNNRTRANYEGNLTLRYDIYQWMVWEYIREWTSSVFQNPDALNKYMTIEEVDNTSEGRAYYEKAMEALANIKNKTYTTAADVSITNNTNIISLDTSNVIGEYTEIGPFTYTYGGTVTGFNIYYNGDTNNILSSAKIIKYNGNTAEEITKENLPNGDKFFIRIKTSELEGKEKVGIWIKVEGDTELKTNIYVLEREGGNGQNVIYVDQEESKEEEKIKNDWDLDNTSVTIQKQDENGNAIKVAGIKFEIYDSENKKVATLTTDENGKTQEVQLIKNKEYTIKETKNTAYGYKKATISSATISSGGILNVTNGVATFTLTEDSIITIENEKKLTEIAVTKEGKDGEKLAGVEFVIGIKTKDKSDLRYLRLYDEVGNFVEYVEGTVTINENNIATNSNGTQYKVEYSNDIVNKTFTGLTDAQIKTLTKFKTDSNGQVTVKNLEVYSTSSAIYEYTVYEHSNTNYGYKIWENRVKNNKANSVELSSETNTGTITNSRHLGNLAIEKYNQSNQDKKLENVEFIIEINDNQKESYLALYDENGDFVANIKEIATINKNNKANSSEYRVEYVSNKSQATSFVTGPKGTITINNLEVYAEGLNLDNTLRKYKYRAIETKNENHGYLNSEVKSKYVYLERETTEIVKVDLGISNEQYLGNITVIKEDANNPNIKLENVGFIVEVMLDGESTSYLALSNKNGYVKEVKGTVTINNQNIATDTEYKLEYVSDKSKATTFLTGDKGILTINNLAVYKKGVNEQYSYTLIETSNSNYGYIVSSQEISNIKIANKETTEATLGNKQELVKISGYVWVENPAGKSNGYDNVYTNNSENGDKILTDLYTVSEGNLSWNANAEIPVKIQLLDKQGNVIKDKPDAFDKDGKYTFIDVKVDKLSEYQVVFIYDGLGYTTVVENLSIENGSKVKEVQSERDALNNKFTSVEEEGKIGNQDNAVTYTKQGNKAKVEKVNIDTTLSANTSQTGLNFLAELENLKKNTTEPVEGIQNINMGLVVREQPDLSMFNDIEKVIIKVNGYEYSYVYATRNLYTEKQENQLGVKFENEAYLTQRYTRAIYASDIQAAKEGSADISVSIVYKMTIVNESRTLTIAPKEIANYCDNSYTIEKDENGKDKVNATSGVQVDVESSSAYNEKYNVAKIKYNGQIKAGEQDEIYITFNVNKEAILKLLDNQSTYHNAAEINKYTSYYSNKTGKIDGKSYMSDSSLEGSIYAGIDEDSAPGNIEIKLINHPSGEGTQILDTSKYEDDTDSAPSLILVAEKERTISGSVWEDTDENIEDDERLGNGIYDNDEKPMANVKLELHKVNEDGTTELAKYSNGQPAITQTNEEGKYTFGGGQDENGKNIGIIPGTYIIKYKYDNETYIVLSESENKNINSIDYKSTIITSGVIESAINNAENITAPDGTVYPANRWYLIDEGNRYSDAADDWTVREELSQVDSVKFGNYNSITSTPMIANTPIMEIGLEYTIGNETKIAEGLVFKNNLEKVDFGIIARPLVNYVIDKDITSLEIVSQTGATIVPKGDPSNPGEKMPGVKTGIEGLVSGEIDEKLLQSATIKIEYTIKILNNSEVDYTEQEYYYYGRNGHTRKIVTIKKVVDYLDAEVKLDPEKVEENKQNGWLKEDGTENIYTDYMKLKTDGLISEDVRKELEKGNTQVFITEKFNDIAVKEEKELKLYASKLLGVSDEIDIYNDVEIIELSGGRKTTSSIPGNYIPTHDGGLTGGKPENDSDRVKLQIVGPTGTTVDYISYIIAIGATLVILVAGIIIIKKKVIK